MDITTIIYGIIHKIIKIGLEILIDELFRMEDLIYLPALPRHLDLVKEQGCIKFPTDILPHPHSLKS